MTKIISSWPFVLPPPSPFPSHPQLIHHSLVLSLPSLSHLPAETLLQLQAERRRVAELSAAGPGWFSGREVEELRARVARLTESTLQHQLQNAELNNQVGD